MNKQKKERSSPSDSAQKYKQFTIKKGNDNNIWINIENKNKVKQWKKLCDNDKNKLMNINLNYIHKIFLTNKNNKKYFYELDILKVKNQLLIGDSIYYPVQGFKKGNYYIYRYLGCLIASKKQINLNELLNYKYNEFMTVSVDYGIFTYHDSYYILKHIEYEINFYQNLLKENKSKLIKKEDSHLKTKINIIKKNYKQITNEMNKYSNYSIGASDTINYYTNNLDDTIINCNDYKFIDYKQMIPNNKKLLKKLKINEENINNDYKKNVLNCSSNNVIYIAGSNYIGDGSYSVLINDKNNLIIQVGGYLTEIIAEIFYIIYNEKEYLTLTDLKL